VAQLDPPLLSMLALPLVHEGSFVAVLALYGPVKNAFTEDHARLLELLAPSLASSLATVRTTRLSEAPPVRPRRLAAADLHVLRPRAETRVS
jgi:GAF domain-containing protein